MVIPFLALLPFLVKNKIIKNKYFWVGILLGFIPFLLWSYNIIFNYNLETYSGLFEKLISLSKNNTSQTLFIITFGIFQLIFSLGQYYQL